MSPFRFLYGVSRTRGAPALMPDAYVHVCVLTYVSLTYECLMYLCLSVCFPICIKKEEMRSSSWALREQVPADARCLAAERATAREHACVRMQVQSRVGHKDKDKSEADLSPGPLVCSCFCCVRRKGCSRGVANSGRAILPPSQPSVRRRWTSKLFCIAARELGGGKAARARKRDRRWDSSPQLRGLDVRDRQ